MEQDGKTYTYHPARYEDGSVSEASRDFVREEPLLIRVEDRPYAVVMRTPGDEIAHAAGFCLSEGLVESPEDIASIGFCSDLDENGEEPGSLNGSRAGGSSARPAAGSAAGR
jgi:FdhD protein